MLTHFFLLHQIELGLSLFLVSFLSPWWFSLIRIFCIVLSGIFPLGQEEYQKLDWMQETNSLVLMDPCSVPLSLRPDSKMLLILEAAHGCRRDKWSAAQVPFMPYSWDRVLFKSSYLLKVIKAVRLLWVQCTSICRWGVRLISGSDCYPLIKVWGREWLIPFYPWWVVGFPVFYVY